MSVDTKAFPELVERGLAALREREFFAAHERFEDAFRRATGRERLLAHGLAQLAASHHQLTLGRARASVSTWHKAHDKLARAGFAGTEQLAREMAAFHAMLGVAREGPRFIDTSALPPRASWPTP